jgi:hypothetical protein
MLSLDECRIALGSMADDKSDDEIGRVREQAAAVAGIVIRTYFGAPKCSLVEWQCRWAVRRRAGSTR